MGDRYPGVFYSRARTQRIGVAAYVGHEDLTFSWLLEDKPGGAWMQLEMPLDEAELFAATIQNRVDQLRARAKDTLGDKG